MDNTAYETAEFLAHLFNEDIYLIHEHQIPISLKESLIAENEPILEKPKIGGNTKPIEIRQESNPNMMLEQLPASPDKIFKKVIIMVGYQRVDVVPQPVSEALSKIFEALKMSISEIEIINVLSDRAPKIEDYQFEYLILMGGNGKNLAFMQSFTNTRNRYDIIKHHGVNVFFAESMDIYFTNLELKKKFWNKLKELFEM